MAVALPHLWKAVSAETLTEVSYLWPGKFFEGKMPNALAIENNSHILVLQLIRRSVSVSSCTSAFAMRSAKAT